jgi:hypothetical protein
MVHLHGNTKSRDPFMSLHPEEAQPKQQFAAGRSVRRLQHQWGVRHSLNYQRHWRFLLPRPTTAFCTKVTAMKTLLGLDGNIIRFCCIHRPNLPIIMLCRHERCIDRGQFETPRRRLSSRSWPGGLLRHVLWQVAAVIPNKPLCTTTQNEPRKTRRRHETSSGRRPWAGPWRHTTDDASLAEPIGLSRISFTCRRAEDSTCYNVLMKTILAYCFFRLPARRFLFYICNRLALSKLMSRFPRLREMSSMDSCVNNALNVA